MKSASHWQPDLSDRVFQDRGRSFLWRRSLIAVLLVPELVALSLPLPASLLPQAAAPWWLAFIVGRRMIAAILVAAFGAAVLLSWDTVFELLENTPKFNQEQDSLWPAWLGVHLVVVNAFVVGGRFALASGALRGPNAGWWSIFGLVLLAGAIASWGLAVMPAEFWITWVKRRPDVIAAALILGAIARVSEFLAMRLWYLLLDWNLYAVALLLRILGQRVIVQPSLAVVGTQRFSVEIVAGCSGLEGVGLVIVLTGAYLWFYRSRFRFPQGFLLIPVGVVLIGLLNVVRITTLVVIGQWWPAVAMDGFHTVAGWLFFNAACFALLAISRFTPWLWRPQARTADVPWASPAGLYLAPLLAIVAVSMITRIFDGGFDYLYPLRVLACGLVLFVFRHRIPTFRVGGSFRAIGLGALAFVLWILLATTGHDAPTRSMALSTRLCSMTSWVAAGWIAFRIMGAVITVPIAEELAFRGYLLRKLVNVRFDTVSYRHFTLLSWVGSSVLFATLHDQWLAGFAVGLVFALAAYLNGRLSDAVVAHATANGLLAVWVLATRNWNLWT